MSDSSKPGFVPHSHVPYGSDGSGFYSDNTLGCYNVVERATPMVLKALAQVDLEKDRPYLICDYGTADGGTSMHLMTHCIAAIEKKHGGDKQIHIVYEDQPVNDFKSLFLRVQGLMPGPPTFLKPSNNNVFITACGTGFYDQCLPNASVHLGFSMTAMHWLSECPGKLTGALHHVLSKNEDELKLFQAQAAKDWQANLLLRAKELVPGGQLVVVCFCVDADGQHLGKSKRMKYSMYQVMTDCLQEMLKDGKITQDEIDKMSFNNYYRTKEEYSAPFNDRESPVSKAGLKLVSIETALVECPYYAKWEKDGKPTDPEKRRAYAKWFIPTTRTWSNYTFLSGLSDKRSEEEKAALVDDMFQRYEDRVAASPEDYGMDYVHAYIHIEKTA